MVERRRTATRPLHSRVQGCSDLQCARFDATKMQVLLLARPRVRHREDRTGGAKFTDVAHLAARLRVERRAIEHHATLLAGSKALGWYEFAVLRREQRHDARVGVEHADADADARVGVGVATAAAAAPPLQ